MPPCSFGGNVFASVGVQLTADPHSVNVNNEEEREAPHFPIFRVFTVFVVFMFFVS
jgi:hypothetical protein